jgi:hypothetical protein
MQKIEASLEVDAMLVAANGNGVWISGSKEGDRAVYFVNPLPNHMEGEPIPIGVELIQMVAVADVVW